MDTLLILRDTITANVIKVVNSSKPCVQETDINCNSIGISLIICVTVVVLALIVASLLFLFNRKKYKYEDEIKKCKEAINEVADLKQKIKELENKFELPNDEKKADNFIEFCQNCKSFEDKMADKCIAIYEDLMKKRLKV